MDEFGTWALITVISVEFLNPGLDLDLVAFSQGTHSWTGGRGCKSWGCSRCPGVGTDAEGIEGSGEEKRGKACSGRKEILPKHSYQFLCVYTEMGGSKVSVRKGWGRMRSKGSKYLVVRWRRELEGPREVLQ